jgi:signal transduction histidine kinase
MRKGSIAASLVFLSAGWLVVALVATGFLLTDLYSRALERSLSETLDFNIESLVGTLLETGDPLSDEIGVTDPRFNRPRSGWYWAITDNQDRLYNLSTSLVGIQVPRLPGSPDVTGRKSGVFTDAFGTDLRTVSRSVSIGTTAYEITVTGNLKDVLDLVDEFRSQAFIVLGAIGVMLAIMSFIVARIALRPIARLSAAVEGVREGDSVSVTGTYPREIAPLAEEVNELLRSNAQIIERARNQVGNLAHGLKTPLAVLRNEAESAKGSLSDIVVSESEKMSSLVSAYLDRARLAARTSVVGKKCDAGPVIDRLARVMGKIHRNVEVDMLPPPQNLRWFRGDEADLEEMVGNLLDNACKWSKGEVRVSLADDQTDLGHMLLIQIDDNGLGLTEDEAKKVLRRGVRLDEKTPGTGLGLDIVIELVDVYGGSLALVRSDLGGLRAELRLPTARLGTSSRPNAT